MTEPTTAAGRPRFSVVMCGHPVAGNAQYPCTEPPGHDPLGHGVGHRHDGAYLAEARQQDGSPAFIETIAALRRAYKDGQASVLVEARQEDTEALRLLREVFKNAIRALPPMRVIDTDYVPQAKRRPDAVIDRAAALLAIEHAALPPSTPPGWDRCDQIVNNGMGEPTECGRTFPCEYHDKPSAPPALDAERLGLSAEQTAILRGHLASRQQTVNEFLGDLLMDAGLGRATGKDYPPPTRLQKQDRPRDFGQQWDKAGPDDPANRLMVDR